MTKAKPAESRSWNASQVVAHNVTRARELRGLTQVEVAERLTRFTGTNWSQATVAQAEGSIAGNRVRQFTANELVALARTFDLPVLFVFLPPDDGSGRLVTDDAKRGHPWEYLMLLVLGHQGNFDVIADRTANWSQVLRQGIDIPAGDELPTDDAAAAFIAGSLRHREPLLPEDVLASVFHGLAARRVQGAKQPGADLTTFIENLRGLADALTAFNNYPPRAFIDERVVEDVAKQRRKRERRRRSATSGGHTDEEEIDE
ncbi:MAG: helix-turn-helix domain-containing protein [Nocardioidaceae bacterium]